MRLACFSKAILFSLVFSLCQAQTTENKTSLFFRLASGDTTVIGRVDSAGVLFFSLNDFLKSLQLPASVNDSTGKIECLIALQLVRFTDRNPFVVITERTSNTATMYQMSGNVIRRRGEFFVPANTFIHLYERLTEQRLSINAQHNTLSLETFRRLEYSVAGIEIEKKNQRFSHYYPFQ
jgi:hypothetical protein